MVYFKNIVVCDEENDIYRLLGMSRRKRDTQKLINNQQDAPYIL
jgi:hypothetical protein